MSLQGIFSPIVRAYFAKQNGGSGSNSDNSRQAAFTINEDTQAFVFVPPQIQDDFPTVDIEGMVLFKACDELPSVPESVMSCTMLAQNPFTGDVETHRGITSNGSFSNNPGVSLGLMTESGIHFMAIFSELAAALGVEPGFYLPESYLVYLVTIVIA